MMFSFPPPPKVNGRSVVHLHLLSGRPILGHQSSAILSGLDGGGDAECGRESGHSSVHRPQAALKAEVLPPCIPFRQVQVLAGFTSQRSDYKHPRVCWTESVWPLPSPGILVTWHCHHSCAQAFCESIRLPCLKTGRL